MASVLGYLKEAACVVCLETAERLYGHVGGEDHAAHKKCLRGLQATDLRGKCAHCRQDVDYSTLFSPRELQERSDHLSAEKLVDRVDAFRADARVAQELEDEDLASSVQQFSAGPYADTSSDAAIARALSQGIELSCTTVVLSIVAIALAALGVKEAASKISS